MQKRVHFFKARSRAGLANPPFGSTDVNKGVEDAPDFILTGEFLKNFPKVRVSEFNFPSPEKIADSYYPKLAKSLKQFSQLINKTLRSDEIPVVVGGDDSVSFSSLIALVKRAKDPKKIGYIRFDSHGDMNLNKTSPTENFHGMYHRPFFGYFDVKEVSKLVSKRLLPQNTIFIGNLILDTEEKRFFKKTNFKNINSQSLSNGMTDIKRLIKKAEFLHIGFDIDVLDGSEAPATGININDGLLMKEVLPILDLVSKHDKLSIDLVEVNPKKKGSGKTIKVAQRLLDKLLVKNN